MTGNQPLLSISILILAIACCCNASDRAAPRVNQAPKKGKINTQTEPGPDKRGNKPASRPKAAQTAAQPQILSRQIDFGGARIHYLSAGPTQARSLLLLHGARFHSGTWQQLGTITLFAEKGFRVTALDLPGYGKSTGVRVQPQSFLLEIMPALGLTRPVVVSPSMSGRFAFPLVHQHPEAVGGFVPVAPAATVEYAPRLGNLKVPTLIIWGEKDRVFPLSQAELLARSIGQSRKLILPGARHPCYLDRPDEFHAALLDFLRTIDR